MPKRDDNYMSAQRTTIARAALEIMLQKGLNETSIRDVCEAAGISMGALYIHFADKTELVLAAFQLNYDNVRKPRKVETWADYVLSINDEKLVVTRERGLRRTRLSLQFVADAILERQNPPGLGAWFEKSVKEMREALQQLHRNGEISLPIGLERTVQTHHGLLTGTGYLAVANKDLDIDELWSGLLVSLAFTAGLKTKHKAPSSRLSTKAKANDRELPR